MLVFRYSSFLLSLFFCACTGSGNESVPAAQKSRPLVAATTTIVADIAANVAGGRMDVISIMKAGEDPHIYDPRPGDARLIARADVVLTNGLHLEGTLHDIVHNNLKDGAVFRELAEDERIEVIESQQYQGAPDPHCWFSIPYVKVYTENAAEALAEADPANADFYRSNAEHYIVRLDSLDRYARKVIGQIPPEKRILVTAHDAFHYFGIEYGVDVMTVIGISTDSEPRPQDVEALVNLVREHGVPAVFIETSVSASLNNLVRKVSEKTGAAVGGTLYSDSLGEPGTDAGTFLGMFRHNVDTIAGALSAGSL
ncbi:MAG: manganese transporter [Candidatus Glassbacteria bacterium]|nr:manganese transporter [Candidatus Glassbacteria bacterium]